MKSGKIDQKVQDTLIESLRYTLKNRTVTRNSKKEIIKLKTKTPFAT